MRGHRGGQQLTSGVPGIGGLCEGQVRLTHLTLGIGGHSPAPGPVPVLLAADHTPAVVPQAVQVKGHQGVPGPDQGLCPALLHQLGHLGLGVQTGVHRAEASLRQLGTLEAAGDLRYQ